MIAEAGMEATADATIDGRMHFDHVSTTTGAAIHGSWLAGLFADRLDDQAQAEMREGLAAHVEALCEPAQGGGISLPAQVVACVGRVPID